jgi:tRNA dimethylallyltransferase
VWPPQRPAAVELAARPRPADCRGLPLLALEPQSRGWLHRASPSASTPCCAGGLLDEVQALRARGDLHAGLPSMRCVGYRQAWEALDSGRSDDLPDRGVAATRQLAKRQLTWLRGMDRGRCWPATRPTRRADRPAAAPAGGLRTAC